MKSLAGNLHQPVVLAGPSGRMWVVWHSNRDDPPNYKRGGVYVTSFEESEVLEIAPEVLEKAGTLLNGAGEEPAQAAQSDIAVGPAGPNGQFQVLVTYQSSEDPYEIFVSQEPDGSNMQDEWTSPLQVTDDGEPVLTHCLPAHCTSVKVGSEPGLAWDQSGGPFRGRVYLVYTVYNGETPLLDGDTDIMLRYSNDMGLTWCDRIKVSDDMNQSSQFFPAIAVDQFTGYIAIAWYDTRDDATNKKTHFYGAVSTDGGVSFTSKLDENSEVSNFKISDTQSDAGAVGGHYRDYADISFDGGIMVPSWSDASSSNFKIFVQRIEVSTPPEP